MKSESDNFLYFSGFQVKKLANLHIISREIAKITGILSERDFIIQNWSEICFCEMLKIAFKHYFS